MSSQADPVHYWLCTDKGRPFLSRVLCDASAQHERRDGRMSPSWDVVTCAQCLALGAPAADAISNLPDAALIALGAWHDGMTEAALEASTGKHADVDEGPSAPDAVDFTITRLDAEGRRYMLGFLRGVLVCDHAISSAQWRAAYGAAVDHQTARQFRAELDQAVPGA